MTTTIEVPGNPSPNCKLNVAINSIVAAAKTANDLESARRKATRDNNQISRQYLNELKEPGATARAKL
jgi:hypothetical protein